VAARNARRNRRRTVFLVLLTAVPTAIGTAAAGVVRARTVTPEETVQMDFGAAAARIRSPGDPEVLRWVLDEAAAVGPEIDYTVFRETRATLDDFVPVRVVDVDLGHALTEGMLVIVKGVAPASWGEAAVSPLAAEEMGLEVGDRVKIDALDMGAVEIVGLVADPFGDRGRNVVLWPGALEEVEPTAGPLGSGSAVVLMGGRGAEAAATRIEERWWREGHRRLLPESAVVPRPVELRDLDNDVYAYLSESQIEELVEMARADPGDFVELYERAEWMMTQTKEHVGVSLSTETREERLMWGEPEERPGLVSTAVSALLLVETAFIAAAAFAAGARRRLREIGLLGASGASERHIRTTVVGEGLTIGLVGAVLGAALGVGALALGRPLIQKLSAKAVVGVGVSLSDVVGPAAVAVAAVLAATLIPARTASKVPTTAALHGRMPESAPRRWTAPAGLAAAAAGGLLITTALASGGEHTATFATVGGATAIVGVAMLAGPVLAGFGRLAGRVPTAARLVLRDSGRHRTRSATAVAAVMVILLGPVMLLTVAETSNRKGLLNGLPGPSNQLLLYGSSDGFGPGPITEKDIAAAAAVVPERRVVVFELLDVRAKTREQMKRGVDDRRGLGDESHFDWDPWSDDSSTAAVEASPALLAVLGDERVADAIGEGRIVVLGVEDKETAVSVGDEELAAVELAVPVVEQVMPRVLLPASVAERHAGPERRPMALFILDRPLSSREHTELWAGLSLETAGGVEYLSDAVVYWMGAGLTLLAVLIVIALVTAVSAAEVDADLAAIVAVGAPGSFRRRFLGLLTGYQTLVAAVLAVPLGVGLVKAFASDSRYTYQGLFGEVSESAVFIPWGPLAALLAAAPVIVALLTSASVRSSPVTPPRPAA